MIELVDDLFAYNDWANGQVWSLCAGLEDDQLDQSREMGFGSLRATLFHLWAADQIWMERWQSVPWRAFPTDPEGQSLEALGQQLRDVAQDRCELIARSRDRVWEQQIEYRDSRQVPYQHRLGDLILHVFIHGTHHRAQALAYLKSFQRTQPMGIDYIFYRTRIGTIPQSEDARAMLANFGMQVGSVPGDRVSFDAAYIHRWFEYHDWANRQILEMAAQVPPDALTRNFDLGPAGTITGTLKHLFDVEAWWLDAMIDGSRRFGDSYELDSLPKFETGWSELAGRRNTWLESLAPESPQQEITISFGGPELKYTIVEALVQTLNHGVHHRAQLINMLRHSDAPIRNIDLLYAIDQL